MIFLQTLCTIKSKLYTHLRNDTWNPANKVPMTIIKAMRPYHSANYDGITLPLGHNYNV